MMQLRLQSAYFLQKNKECVGWKLILPGNLAAFRATLNGWLVRDADFVAAFHAVGEAVGGTKELGESLDTAYTAVFGDTENAVEVLSAEPMEEQEILGFSYVTPLRGTLTSEFGLREDPNTGKETMHYGVDIAANYGDCVISSLPGTVTDAGFDSNLGNYVKVKHSENMETVYGHMSEILVKKGEVVDSNTRIGSAGATGAATGPHVHLEVRIDGQCVDPEIYLPKE